IEFASGVSGTITLTSGELDITDSVDLQGPGAGVLTVSGNNASRVFRVSTGESVTIRGLTIAGGTAFEGGGIYNDGTLTLEDSIVSGNSVSLGGSGGGIYNDSTLTVRNSTLSGNSAGGDPATNGFGGGIYNFTMLTVEGSTFVGNSSSYEGGGIAN